MRLTDLMSGANLDMFATVSLIFFLIAFVAVVIRVATMSRREVNDAANLPLEDHSAHEESTHVR